MEKEINYGKFITTDKGVIFVKHCNFNDAILWITKELSLPLTIFEDIKRRGVNKIIFINTNTEGELAGVEWIFDTDWIDIKKKEKRMFQETQYYFPIIDKLPNKKIKENTKIQKTLEFK